MWTATTRDHTELMSLVRDGYGLQDIGVTRSLAVRESHKFPWQDYDAG
jgi:uncharacterized protein YjiS (DUF1127 family)